MVGTPGCRGYVKGSNMMPENLAEYSGLRVRRYRRLRELHAKEPRRGSGSSSGSRMALMVTAASTKPERPFLFRRLSFNARPGVSHFMELVCQPGLVH